MSDDLDRDISDVAPVSGNALELVAVGRIDLGGERVEARRERVVLDLALRGVAMHDVDGGRGLLRRLGRCREAQHGTQRQVGYAGRRAGLSCRERERCAGVGRERAEHEAQGPSHELGIGRWRVADSRAAVHVLEPDGQQHEQLDGRQRHALRCHRGSVSEALWCGTRREPESCVADGRRAPREHEVGRREPAAARLDELRDCVAGAAYRRAAA